MADICFSSYLVATEVTPSIRDRLVTTTDQQTVTTVSTVQGTTVAGVATTGMLIAFFLLLIQANVLS